MVYDCGKYKVTLKKVIRQIEDLDESSKTEWVVKILDNLGCDVMSKIYRDGYRQGRFDEAMECSTPKVEIPSYVSHWLEYCKATNINLVNALKVLNVHLYNYARMADSGKLRSYFSSDKNQESFIVAWINDYFVKKEKYYYVAVPVEHGRFRRLCMLANGSVALGDHNYESLELLKKHSRQATFQLTEKLIKESPLSWAWQFAKEFEE